MEKKNKAAQALGKRGGMKTLENKGKDHFSLISKEGWKKRRSVDKVA